VPHLTRVSSEHVRRKPLPARLAFDTAGNKRATPVQRAPELVNTQFNTRAEGSLRSSRCAAGRPVVWVNRLGGRGEN
jgi:hypothetical protein